MKQIDNLQPDKDHLYNNILRKVSRSFYLTLKILPVEIHDTLSLTYLLARITDNIIDDTSISYYKKIYFIYLLRNEITENSNEFNKSAFDKIQLSLLQVVKDKELLQALPLCLQFFWALPQADKQIAVKTLLTIFSGFEKDTDTFTYRNKMVCFKNMTELDEYLYQIAGCIGEFWTELGFLHWPNYSKLSLTEAKSYAVEFGKALQLVNILRDLPNDLKENRCYIPAEQLDSENIDKTNLRHNPQLIFPLVNDWRIQAEKYLDSAANYIINVKIKSLRLPLLLPYFIAVNTLKLLENDDYLTADNIAKVDSLDMKMILIKAKFASIIPQLFL